MSQYYTHTCEIKSKYMSHELVCDCGGDGWEMSCVLQTRNVRVLFLSVKVTRRNICSITNTLHTTQHVYKQFSVRIELHSGFIIHFVLYGLLFDMVES